MAEPIVVNLYIPDSVTESNVKVLGNAPELHMSGIYMVDGPDDTTMAEAEQARSAARTPSGTEGEPDGG